MSDRPHHHPLALVIRVVALRCLGEAAQQVVEPLLGVDSCRMLRPGAQDQHLNWTIKIISKVIEILKISLHLMIHGVSPIQKEADGK